jgi:hypothetical protein
MSAPSPFALMRRLHERGPRSRGLTVDRDGVALGPQLTLLRRTQAGYECLGPDVLMRVARGPLLVPNNVSIKDNARAGEKILAEYNKALETDAHGADGDRFGTMMRLFDYGGEMDYQRTYGAHGHINQSYIDIGNYNYGPVMAAAGYSWTMTAVAATVVNWRGEGDKAGPLWSNPRNLDIAPRVR